MSTPVRPNVNVNITDSCNSCCPCLPSRRRKNTVADLSPHIKKDDELHEKPTVDAKVEGVATAIMKEIDE
jgi:hypothetical protein